MTAAALMFEAYVGAQPDDAARRMESRPAAELATLFESLGTETIASVLQHLAPARAAAAVEAMPVETAVGILETLPVSTVANFLRGVPGGASSALLAGMPVARRDALTHQLSYPADCAAGVMDPLVVAVPQSATAAEARALLEAHVDQVYYYLYVVDPEHRIVGVFDMAELMRAAPGAPVRTFMRTSVRWLAADAPLVSVFAHPGWRDLDAMPVADAEGRLLGVLRHLKMRRLFEERSPDEEGVDGVRTVIALGELYWLGLCGVLQGFSTAPVEPVANDRGTP